MWCGALLSLLMLALSRPSGAELLEKSCAPANNPDCPVIETPPTNLTVELGDTFTLTCLVRGNPAPVVTWCLNESLLSRLLQDNINISENSLTVFQATDSFLGNYVCRAENEHGIDVSMLARVLVRAPPEFGKVVVDVVVDEGEELILPCEARGWPTPTIWWRYEGAALEEEEGRVEVQPQGDLTISPVRVRDEGVYRCIASNELGNVTSNPATITVYVAPSVTTFRSDAEVDAGANVTLLCAATSNPPPSYSWSHIPSCEEEEAEDEAEEVGGGRVRVLSEGSLFISSAGAEDRGRYQCHVHATGFLDRVTITLRACLVVYGPPPPPSDVSVLSVGSTWAEVKWEPGIAQPAASDFIVQLRLAFQDEWRNSTTSSFTVNVTGLYPSAGYTLRVLAISPKGWSGPSEEGSFSTLQGVPLHDTPEDVTVMAGGPNHIHVNWTVPVVLHQTSYNGTRVVVHHPGGNQTHFLTNATSLTVDMLEPATDYSLSVNFLFRGNFEGRSSHARASTPDGPPCDPPNITMVTSTADSITVSWVSPLDPNGNITSYTIAYRVEGGGGEGGGVKVVEGDADHVVLMNLTAFTTYTIEVSANTSGGAGPAALVNVTTDEAAPTVAPMNLSVTALSHTVLMLSWIRLREEDIPGLFVNYTINITSDDPEYRELITAPSLSIEVTGLTPYALYTVSVAGATGGGVGKFSAPEEARTLGNVSSAMLAIRAVAGGPTSLRLSWREPSLRELGGPRGSISYALVYQLTGGNRLEGGGNVSLNAMEVTSNGEVNHHLMDLMVYAEYRISVAVANDNGTGPFSAVMQTTGQGAPTSPPTNLQVSPINSTALLLSWQPPSASDVPGNITHYQVVYRQNGSQTTTNTTSPDTTFELADLEAYTVYNVSIAAATVGGVGPLGMEVPGRTLGDAPTAAVVVAVWPVCPPSSLAINWSAAEPASLRGPPEEAVYVLSWRSETGEEERNTSVPYGMESHNLTGLQFNTSYTVSITVSNVNGTGPPSAAVTGRTKNGLIPAPPEGLNATEVLPRAVTVSWTTPTVPGRPDPEVRVQLRSSSDQQNTTVQTSLASFGNLQPATNYMVTVAVVPECGAGEESAPLVVRTLELPPRPLATPISVLAMLPDSIRIGWSLDTMAMGDYGPPTSYKVGCGPGDSVTSDDAESHECVGLREQTSYNLSVTPLRGAREGEPVRVSATTTCKPQPPSLVTDEEGEVKVTFGPAMSCTNMFLYTLVVVCEVSSESGRCSIEGFSEEDLKRLTMAYQGQREGGRGRRQAAMGVYIAANLTGTGSEFTLGDDSNSGGYQNYPLLAGVIYAVTLRSSVAGTNTAVFSSAPTTTFMPTEPPASSLPIIPIAAGAGGAGLVIVAIVIISLVICCCCCLGRSGDKEAPVLERAGSLRLSRMRRQGDPLEEFRSNNRTEQMDDHQPVSVDGFSDHLLMMRTNDNQLFLEEFGSIVMEPQLPAEVASISFNQPRNRYNNILPYDRSRVKLRHAHGQDYINASFIDGYMRQKAYISTQGPLPATIPDFWKMVWEEHVPTIVMLTNPVERGKIKCEVYWPREVGSSTVHGSLEITLTAETQLADYRIRTFSLHKSGSSKEGREVKQFHFTSWPDHGVPQYATAMLTMVRRVSAHHRPEHGPMLVHCSAGVGRSGTFMTIDAMLERLKHGSSSVDVYGHVSLIRTQRPYMVQTEDQYFFIYEAIAEAIVCGETEVSLDQLPGYISELVQPVSSLDQHDMIPIELQFKRLAIDKNDPHMFASANKECNNCKNRFVNVLPFETNRVYLDYLRGQDGSDYINASFIDSYHSQKAFIASQGPLQNTVNDFWRMLWRYKAPVVIMLTKLMEKGAERSACYWPSEANRPVVYGGHVVEMTAERDSGHYVYRDLYLTEKESGERRLVRHFQFVSWPESGVPATGMPIVEFLREVQKLCATLPSKEPIVVHCSNGIGRSGVFIALHILMERMSLEGLVDVFQTVKNLRIQRPAMVQTLAQYQFCYDAMLDYLQSSDLLQFFTKRFDSGASDVRRKGRNASPARSDSLSRKGSFRNRELAGGAVGNGAQIYGGSEATSTFGTQSSPSPRSSLQSGGSQVHLTPAPLGQPHLAPPTQTQLQDSASGTANP